VPISEESEAILKGKVEKSLTLDEIKLGLNGDVERQFKLLGFAD
jgi:hypothetical protein